MITEKLGEKSMTDKPENIDKELESKLNHIVKLAPQSQRELLKDELKALIHSSNKSFASQIAQKNKEIKEEMNKLRSELDELADKHNIPSITTWYQGYFKYQRQYRNQPKSWIDEQDRREKTIIRPHGGTNNALFKITGSQDDANIANYLEELGKLLRLRL